MATPPRTLGPDGVRAPRRGAPWGAAGAFLLAAGTFIALAGPLDPPAGPVSPTYKTLSEVEPRIAITEANTPGDANSLYRITAPGSYYLASDLTGTAGKKVIEIASRHVTLDLAGHYIFGGPGSLDGIATDGIRDHVTVRNGSVLSCGDNGILLASNGFLVERIQASNNGEDGIHAGDDGIIRDCTAMNNAWIGISAFYANRIERCESRGNGTHGFFVSSHGAIIDCRAIGNVGDGIRADDFANLVRACAAQGNGNNGIYAGAWCLVEGNVCNGNGPGSVGAGIWLSESDNVAAENIVGGNTGYGISVGQGGARNLIVRNHAQGNTPANYPPSHLDNVYGTIVGSESAMNGATNENVNWSF